MNEDKKNKLINFFVGTPAYNDDKDYAAFASFTAPLNMFFLICLVLHTIYISDMQRQSFRLAVGLSVLNDTAYIYDGTYRK